MSLDASLKSGSGLNRHRNVLTRAERLQKLLDAGRIDSPEDASVLGMPKVAHRKMAIGKKTPKKPDAAEETKGKKKK